MNRRSATSTTTAGLAAAVILAGCTGTSSQSQDPTQQSSSTPTTSATPTIPEQTKAPGVERLRLGVLLSATGDEAVSADAGTRMAVREIKADGGVLGRPVKVVRAKTGDGSDGAVREAAQDVVKRGAVAVVSGAAPGSSVVALEQMQETAKRRHRKKAARPGEVVMVSATDMSPSYDNLADDDLAFRTVPSNVLEAGVVADQITRTAQGERVRVAILVSTQRDDQALADQITAQLARRGAPVVEKVEYAPGLSGFAPEVKAVKKAKADAMLLIGGSESSQILGRLVRDKVGPQQRPTFLVDSNTLDYSRPPHRVKRSIAGTQGVEPGGEVSDPVLQKLHALEPDLAQPRSAPEAYDATMLIALAAQSAGDTTPDAIAGDLVDVSEGGRPCHGFTACRVLIDRGVDIDYQGLSGLVDLNETGSPSRATMGVMTYDGENAPQPSEYVRGEVR